MGEWLKAGGVDGVREDAATASKLATASETGTHSFPSSSFLIANWLSLALEGVDN